MTYDPRKTVDTPATNPNRGMQTRPYMASILIALVALLIGLFVILAIHPGSKATPRTKPDTTTNGATNPSPQ